MYAKRLAVGAVLLSLLAGIGGAAEHTKDSLAQVKQRIKDKKAILIDVREESEWEQGHLDRAALVPLSKIKQGKNPKLDSKDIIIYCH